MNFRLSAGGESGGFHLILIVVSLIALTDRSCGDPGRDSKHNSFILSYLSKLV